MAPDLLPGRFAELRDTGASSAVATVSLQGSPAADHAVDNDLLLWVDLPTHAKLEGQPFTASVFASAVNADM